MTTVISSSVDSLSAVAFTGEGYDKYTACDAQVKAWREQGVKALRVGGRFQSETLFASPGPFYYIGDYERNGHDDSDFYVVFWDDATNRVYSMEYSSTRYGGGWNYLEDMTRVIPSDVMERIRVDVYNRTLSSLVAMETARCETPDPDQMPFGARVRITANSRKGCKTPYAKGETGEVCGQYWFGTFYSNGYNSKGRGNGRLQMRMTDGRKVFVAMNLARLDCEPNLAACEAKAKQVAAQPMPISCPGAWWTNVNQNICV